MKIEAFIFTNGRSTFDHCLSSTKEQSVLERIGVFSNTVLVNALNSALTQCKCSHFVKVDDDFIFHPRAIEYMWKRFLKLPDNGKIGIYCSHLWEDWTKKPISGVKIYSVRALNYVGGFIADRHGKVDKSVSARLIYSGYQIYRDPSVVGLHACGAWEEQLRYEQIWNGQASVSHLKSTRNEMQRYQVPLIEQVQLRTRFIEEYNGKNRTKFGRWLSKQELKGF